MANFGGDDIDKVITGGIVFSGGAKKTSGNSNAKVKTKAKKKAYITGAHGSGSAKMKAEIRRRRANRHKKVMYFLIKKRRPQASPYGLFSSIRER